MFDTFISNVLATIVGGIFLAFIFFWTKEKWFPLPDINGKWHFRIETIKTAYRPYDGMILGYVALLWREGTRIEGTVEKIYENSTTGEREYVGNDRTRGKVQGYIEKNYFKPDRIYLHVIEDGHGRESTNYYDLLITTDGKMDGIFHSMVANQDGKAFWQREQFSEPSIEE